MWVLVVVLVVTGVKQSQLLGLRLSLEFDNNDFESLAYGLQLGSMDSNWLQKIQIAIGNTQTFWTSVEFKENNYFIFEVPSFSEADKGAKDDILGLCLHS